MAKILFKRSFLFLLIIVAVISGCKHKPEIAGKLYERYQNKTYEDFDTAAYHAEFKKQFAALKPRLRHTDVIEKFYTEQNNEPHFVNQFLVNGQINTLVQYLSRANEHGLDTVMFHPGQITALLNQIHANRFTNITQVYPVFAKLEIITASAFLNYSGVVHFGVVNPHSLYRRYDMVPKRPDSAFYQSVFNTPDMAVFLHDIQPQSPAYLALKKALAAINTNYVDSGKMQRMRIIKLNMERLRWQNPEKESKYIFVNIPSFTLQWIENGKPVLSMKVCVGEPKGPNYDAQLLHYLETRKLDDKPANHETTILNSRVTTIQLNPTWSIPSSIAQSETYFNIQKNPDYLADNNIRVYSKYTDREVDPDTINWSRIARDKMPFRFQQDASDQNALGKLKFIFENEAGIYLHDTNNKAGFLKPWRAISHGCVRVQDPLMLAQQLIGDTTRMDGIRMEVGLAPRDSVNKAKYAKMQQARLAPGFQLKSKFLDVPNKGVQVFIDYYTCLPDDKGELQFYYDAYHMDEVLEKAMGKYFAKSTR
ncbi:L,D-transpeptidase family protein [Mucilaginibacter sp. AW1-3]